MARLGIAAVLAAMTMGSIAMTHAGDDPFLEAYAETYRFRNGRPSDFRLAPDGRSMLFLRGGSRDFVRSLYRLDLESGKEREVLTAEDLLAGAAEALTEQERARRERQRQSGRGITRYVPFEDGRRVLVPLSGRLYVVDLRDRKSTLLGPDEGGAISPQLSPDERRIAYARNGEVHVVDIADGSHRAITQGAGGSVVHGEAEFVAQEEMSRNEGFWWSPDSKFILYQRTDNAGLDVMKIMDAVRPDKEPSRWPYPRPGKTNADVRLGIVPVGGGETRWVEWDRKAFEYVAQVRWPADAPLTVLVQNRRQTEQQLLRVDPSSGATRPLLIETDDAWIDIDQNVPLWLEGDEGFLWTTERGGSWQLELRAPDGAPKRFLTPPELGFFELEMVDSTRRRVLVRGGSDPTQSHLFWVPLDGGRALQITSSSGVHDASGNGLPFVLSTATPSQPRRYMLHDGTKSTGVQLRSLEETPSLSPQLEFTSVGDDTRFHAVLIRPEEFDAKRRYPVIVHVYGGPTSQMVQQDASRYYLDQWLANRGFIVVAIDGRGTPRRGRDWSRSVRHDLIGKPLEDQAAVVQLLGRRYPEMDVERVGIYGWSFGGYFSAMAVARRPDLFKAGVAGAPVVDWLDYDTHYTERYMDLPEANPQGYRDTNVLTYAAKLERPLLLIHGTADDNVYLVHSLKLADALLRAGRPFDFLPLPGHTHSVREPVVVEALWGRVAAYFEQHLGNPAP